MKKYYLYAGYYELWISDKVLGAPLTFISWHKSLDNAMKAAERYDEEAHVITDRDLVDEAEEYAEIAEMSEYAA